MNLALKLALPVLLPRAVAWAQDCEREALAFGIALGKDELALARRTGVVRPERIRLSVVDALPEPNDPELRKAAVAAGLFGPVMAGLTLGYAIYVRRGRDSPRVLSHELRHVHQYERARSIEAFLRDYLQQVVEVGYHDAPLEIDARAHELDG